jgi:hypothetical protein
MLRRQLIAVLLVCLVVVGVGYHVIHENPGFTDVGTIGFVAPPAIPGQGVNSRGTQAIRVATVEYMMGPEAAQLIKARGATAAYDVELVNGYNEEFPDYSQPYVQVTTNSLDPNAAQDTYNIVVGVMQKNLLDRQADLGAKNTSIIRGIQVNTTGPTIQTGSRKRGYAAIVILMIIVAFLAASLLDRRGLRLAWPPRKLAVQSNRG